MAVAMTIGNVLVLLEARRKHHASDDGGGEGGGQGDGDGDGGGGGGGAGQPVVDLGLSRVVGVTTGAMVPRGAWLSRRCDPDGKRGPGLLAAISLVLVATGLYVLAVQIRGGA